MTLGTWFWPKSQSLTFQYKVKFWSVDWKIHLSILCIWDLLNLLNGSRKFHWVLKSMCDLDFPLARSNSQKLPLCSQNPKNDHFALLVIWSNFLWNCDPNLIKWSMWVYNVDVGQFSWDLTGSLDIRRANFSAVEQIVICKQYYFKNAKLMSVLKFLTMQFLIKQVNFVKCDVNSRFYQRAL